MKIIPSFKPPVSFRQLNAVSLSVLCNRFSSRSTDIFKNNFAQYLSVKYAIPVPSGRWALYYILQNLNLKEGDEVILPAFTYFAVLAAIVRLKLRPVFVDIEPDSLSIDLQRIKENITIRTKVIISTHLCGFVYQLDNILDIAKKKNIKVIEDCAQSLGSEYRNKKTGSWGDAAYFTFGITKNFTTLGGGMIVTDSSDLAEMIQNSIDNLRAINRGVLSLRLSKAYSMKLLTSPFLFPTGYFAISLFSYIGVDIIDCIFHEKETLMPNIATGGQLSYIQSELGVAQLREVNKNNEERRKRGLILRRKLKGVDHIRLPTLDDNAKNIFSGFPIFVKNKKIFKKKLLKNGIDVSMGYMQDCSRLDIFKDFKKECPNAAKAAEEVLYLPLYPELTNSELEYIVTTVKNCG